MTWGEDDVPSEGHYCFIALIDAVDDPAPNKDVITSPDQYYEFIRNKNNATWKNFDVAPITEHSAYQVDFQIQGWPKQKLSSDLMIDVASLPPDFNVNFRILKRLTKGAILENMSLFEETELYRVFELKPGNVSQLKNMSLKSSENSQASLMFIIPEGASDGRYRVSLAQIVDGREMGRVTRMIAVGKYPFIANSYTKEVHVSDCDWAAKIGLNHKVAFNNVDSAIRHGYNDCRFCLPEYSTD